MVYYKNIVNTCLPLYVIIYHKTNKGKTMLNLITPPNSFQNKMNLKRPFHKDGSPTNASKFILSAMYISENLKRDTFSRKEIILNSFSKRFLSEDLIPDGWMSAVFSALSANKVIVYDASKKVLKKGENFEAYISEYGIK